MPCTQTHIHTSNFFLSSGMNLSKRYMHYIGLVHGFSPFPLLSCLIAIASYRISFDYVDYPHFKCFWNSPVGSYQRLCHAMIFVWYWYVQPWFWTLRELSNIHLTGKKNFFMSYKKSKCVLMNSSQRQIVAYCTRFIWLWYRLTCVDINSNH